MVSGMFKFAHRLKRHPFPVVARFERVVAVSFAFPPEVLRPLVPEPLEIDTHAGFGFITVALVWTRNLRPAFFPRFLGQDFFLAGYRVFTRLRDEKGRRLRGLKIIRSETDKARMVWSGNLLTHYAYRRVRVATSETGGAWKIHTELPDGTQTLKLAFDTKAEVLAPPEGSPFPDWHTARLFAGPMPFTFDHEGDGRFVIIEGKRATWTPTPVLVSDWDVALFDETPIRGTRPILANAFMVENVDYRWERGRIVIPNAEGEAHE